MLEETNFYGNSNCLWIFWYLLLYFLRPYIRQEGTDRCRPIWHWHVFTVQVVQFNYYYLQIINSNLSRNFLFLCFFYYCCKGVKWNKKQRKSNRFTKKSYWRSCYFQTQLLSIHSLQCLVIFGYQLMSSQLQSKQIYFPLTN